MPQPSATKPLGSPFIELQSVDSTNNYAFTQIHAGLAQHGMTLFAHEQLAGKGQRGKGWIGEKHANIIMSVLIKPGSLQPVQQFWLSACVALATYDFFKSYAGNETKIKWPNDLYWQDRKAGGILIENIVGSNDQGTTQWKWAVVGIGININQTSFPVELQNPVSLKQITGKDLNVVDLAKELGQQLNNYFEQLITNGFENIYTQYLTHLYKRNEKVKLKQGNRIFAATILGVSLTGKLIIKHTIEEEFDFGEVEWVV